MRTSLLVLTFIFFIGCSQSNVKHKIQSKVSKIDKEDDFNELDRIDAQMQNELSESNNALMQIKHLSCPVP